MFRRLQAIQSPINVNRQGHRDHVGPDINLYYANGYQGTPGLYQLTATPYGTYSPSSNENLLNSDNIPNHTGIGTFSESISTPLQVGINWYPTDLQPDHLYSHYVLTIERKTFNQGKNVDIGVTQNVVQGPSTITSNVPSGFGPGDEWQPFEIRDGNEPFWAYADNQPQKYIHNFTNVDLIDEGFLYYSILFYPDWDGSYHGPYGLNGFQKIFRSFIWMIYDDLSEQDEDFYVRLRGIKKDTNFAPEGGPEQVNIFPGDGFPYFNKLTVSEYPDFITNQDQSRIPESVILSETILRIDGTSSIANPDTGINTLYHSEYQGVVGLSPNLDSDHFSDPNNRERDRFTTVNYDFEDFFEGRPGNSGWDYPQMIWAPLLQPYAYDDDRFVEDPPGGVVGDENYFGMTTETAGVNSPIGPFCGYYTACTFISTYTANELRTAGMTTGSILGGVTYDVVQNMYKSADPYGYEKPINPFLSIVNVEQEVETATQSTDIMSTYLKIKAHNQYHPRINGDDFPLGMNIYNPYDISTNIYADKKFATFNLTKDRRFAVGGTNRRDQDKYIWNGKDAIALVASYDYQGGSNGSSNPFEPSNYRIGGDDDRGYLRPALVRMAKTYLNGNNGRGSLAYIFPDDVSTDSNYFTASAKDRWLWEVGGGYNNNNARPSFTSASSTPKYFSFDTSTVSHNTTTTYNAKKYAKYNIAARPIIKLDWTNLANPNAVLDFNIGFLNDTTTSPVINWTHDTALSAYLWKTNGHTITNTSDWIGPLPITYVNNAGITTTETLITGVGQSSDKYGRSYDYTYDRSDATIDLSDYTGIGPVRVVFRAVYQKPYTLLPGSGTVVTRPIRLKSIYLRAPLDFVNRSYYHEDTYPPETSSTYRRGIYVSGDDPSDHDTFNKFTLHRYGTEYVEDWPGDTLQEWEVSRGNAFDADNIEDANPSPLQSTTYDAPLNSGQTGTVGGSRWFQKQFTRNEGCLELQSGSESPVVSDPSFHGDFLMHKETFII